MKVVVANGKVMNYNKICTNFQWLLQGETFLVDIFLISLENYHMVLGVQWLIILEDILWNFNNITMRLILK